MKGCDQTLELTNGNIIARPTNVILCNSEVVLSYYSKELMRRKRIRKKYTSDVERDEIIYKAIKDLRELIVQGEAIPGVYRKSTTGYGITLSSIPSGYTDVLYKIFWVSEYSSSKKKFVIKRKSYRANEMTSDREKSLLEELKERRETSLKVHKQDQLDFIDDQLLKFKR